MSTTTANAAPAMVPHTRTEDAVAIGVGVTLISVGVAFLASAGLLTGGMAGLAFVLHYATGIGFGKLFFALALMGQATMWMAVVADMGVSLLVVANGLRLRRWAGSE